MPDMKNFHNENGLKHADAEKAGATPNPVVETVTKQRRGDRGGFKVMKSSARKKLPIVIDIIIALLIVAVAVGAVFGAFYAFRYFTVDYDTVNVEYTVILDEAIGGKLKNESVYFENDGSTYYFGKIKSATLLEDGAQIIVITSSARFKPDEGYTLGGVEKLAVGGHLTLRTAQRTDVSGTVVELLDKTNPREINAEKGGK